MTEQIEPGSEEWYRRVAAVAAETAAPPDSLWWLSFTNPDLPTGEQFLGGCFVAASNMPAALTVSHMLGINPGGQVMMQGPIPAEAAMGLPERFRNRLMSRDEITEMDAIMDRGSN